MTAALTLWVAVTLVLPVVGWWATRAHRRHQRSRAAALIAEAEAITRNATRRDP